MKRTPGNWEWFACAYSVDGNVALAAWSLEHGEYVSPGLTVLGGTTKRGKPVSAYPVPESLVAELLLLRESFPAHQIHLYRRRPGVREFDECKVKFRPAAASVLSPAGNPRR